MPVVYNRSETGKSKEDLKKEKQKPAKAKSAKSGAAAGLDGDTKKFIIAGGGGFVLIAVLIWFFMFRGGDSTSQEPGPIANNAGPGKTAGAPGGGTAGKKGGAVGMDEDAGGSGLGGLKGRNSAGAGGDDGIK